MNKAKAILTKVMNQSIKVRHRSQEVNFSILYEDPHLLIINKPTLMLSVPGRNYPLTHPSSAGTEVQQQQKEPRNVEWQNAINHALISSNPAEMSEECLKILHLLSTNRSVPRKKTIFDRWVSKNFQIENKILLQEVWESILSSDKQLHTFDIESVPLERVSAQELLQQYCGDVVAVHRLDCETSGALIYAKSDDIASKLGKLFQTRMVQKKYLAIVFGIIPTQEEFTLEFPLNGLYEERPKQRVDYCDGKHAATHVKVIGTSSHSQGSHLPPLSVVELTPITGRTHQLRVHMSHIGHPILGDTLYAPPDVMEMSSRLELHAREIKFIHPITEEEIHLVAPNLLTSSLWPGGESHYLT